MCVRVGLCLSPILRLTVAPQQVHNPAIACGHVERILAVLVAGRDVNAKLDDVILEEHLDRLDRTRANGDVQGVCALEDAHLHAANQNHKPKMQSPTQGPQDPKFQTIYMGHI